MFHNVTTVDDAVEVAAQDSGRCVGSESLVHSGDAVKHCSTLLRRLVYPGMYALTAYDWIGQFGATNVVVVDTHVGQEQLKETVGRAFESLAPLLVGEAATNASLMDALQPSTRVRMRDLYAQQIEWLVSLAGSDFPRRWTQGLELVT
jgi:hypothetical protein